MTGVGPTDGRAVTDRDLLRGFARDASGLELVPESVLRPRDERDVAEAIAAAGAAGTTITAAGAQTSTTGASITDRGALMSLRALARIGEVDPVRRTVRAQCGVIVADLRRACAERGLLFAPDPTSDEDCTVGGAVACNASGARSYAYGATRPHVRALRVALADGRVEEFRRPQLEKNTAGYLLAQEPVDWFVGSEGTLGVVLDAEFALLPLPARTTGIAIPFPSEAAALSFVVAARESASVAPRCLEYTDAQATGFMRRAAADESWARGAAAMVYVEDSGSDAEAPLERWLALVESCGGLADDVRTYEGEAALREARRLRHAVPAAMHERAAPYRALGGRRVSTDWAVPYRDVAAAIDLSRREAEGRGIEPAVTYGHAGNGHPHQNWVARDPGELHVMEGVVEATLRAVIARGGTVSAEHGIGKLKRRWLPLQLGERQFAAMRALKQALDPAGTLAPGNLW
ncbi:MAG: FAD-binding oxidoreductase [Gemmatimonadetes bacterium]|nr:FAD-binding oxidoreductase [Gemmatimonadota bacterium]